MHAPVQGAANFKMETRTAVKNANRLKCDVLKKSLSSEKDAATIVAVIHASIETECSGVSEGFGSGGA